MKINLKNLSKVSSLRKLNREISFKPSILIAFWVYFISIASSFILWGFRYDINPIIQEVYLLIVTNDLVSPYIRNSLSLETISFLQKEIVDYLGVQIIIFGLFLWSLKYILITHFYEFIFSAEGIVIRSGFFDKKEDFFDYDRIFDIEKDSPIWLRIFGKTNLLLIANDYSSNNKELFNNWIFNLGGRQNELLDRLSQASKEQEGVSLDIKFLLGLKKEEAIVLKKLIIRTISQTSRDVQNEYR